MKRPDARESRRVSRTELRTGAGTVASRVTGMLRLVAVAYALGGFTTAESYNLANNTPNIVHDLVLGGVLSASFVPVFVERLASRPRREAERSISAVVTMSLLLLIVATLLLIVLAPVIVDLYMVSSHGTDHAAERALSIDLLRFFAPQVLAYGVISLIAAVLATKDRFAAVGVAPVLNNLVAIAILAVFASVAHGTELNGHPSHGHLVLLGLGTTLGVVLQALALVPSLVRSGVRLRPTWRPRDPALGAIGRLSGWTFGFVVANQIAVFVVLALAVHLDKVSDYTYAYTFFLFPYAVVAVTVVNVVTPRLARAFVAGDDAGIGRTFGGAGRQVLALILPAAVGYLVLAKPIVTLVLGHGAFVGPNDITPTAETLAFFALGLPGFCLYALAIRTFQAMQDTRTAFVCYVLENGANILLAFLLYRALGVRGLAISYSIAYTIGAIAAIAVLRERVGTVGGRAIAAACARSIVLSLVMAVVIAFISAVVGSGTGVLGWLRLLITVAIGGLVYLGGAGIAASTRGWQTSRRPRH